jgi:hypothetical protein
MSKDTMGLIFWAVGVIKRKPGVKLAESGRRTER